MNTYLETIKNSLQAVISKNDIQHYYIGKPNSFSKVNADRGILVIEPVSTDIQSITTGLNDREDLSIRIIIAKQIQEFSVRNAEKESGSQWLMRVMDGREPDNRPKTNTIRYVVRSNYRQWSTMQPSVNIDYESTNLENFAEGLVEATLTVQLTGIFQQPV
jgi:hypothetical protein